VPIFYTADMHFFHANILAHVPTRPWSTVEAMNAGLVERWNATVSPGDTVWVLGDVALSSSKLGPVAELNGRKLIVAGNHDACWSERSQWLSGVRRYGEAGFCEVFESGAVRNQLIGPSATAREVHLAHFPYEGDSRGGEDRYVDHRLVDDGTPLLCGHVHDAWTWKRTARGTPQVNVGVDVWDWRPVPEATLASMLDLLVGRAAA
jgi:calcineurin-like phosphoesterase family protein